MMTVLSTALRTVDNDPHFVVSVAGLKEAVCFDVDGEPGSVLQLLHDKLTGNKVKVAHTRLPSIGFRG